MHLHVLHETRYDYQPAVSEGRHRTCLHPRDTDQQRVLAHQLRIQPEPATRDEQLDTFGNPRCSFYLDQAHAHLVVVAESWVETRATTPVQNSLAWEAVQKLMGDPHRPMPYGTREFAQGSPLAPQHADFGDYAASDFPAGRPLHEAAWALMQRIHRDFAYAPQVTHVHTSAHEVLALRRGVCQDFAHLMLACLRSFGLAARYVSGYLLTQPPPGQPRLIGADASHAWVSVWLPDPSGTGGVWWDLDPTNNRCTGEDYVTLAWGRDYADVSPLSGVIHGSDNHQLAVAVTVEPVPLESVRKYEIASPS